MPQNPRPPINPNTPVAPPAKKAVVHVDPPVTSPSKDRLAQIKTRAQGLRDNELPPGAIPPIDAIRGHERPARPAAPTDALSPERIRDLQQAGKLMPGVGSAFVANQAIAAGQGDKVEEFKKSLSEQTVQQLGSLGKDFARQSEEDAQISARAAAEKEESAREERAFGEELRQEKEEKKDDRSPRELIKDTIELADPMYLDSLYRLLNNPARRKLIEERIVDKMDIAQLIINEELTQRVPISASGAFTVTYRVISQYEDMMMKQLAASKFATKLLRLKDDARLAQLVTNDVLSIMNLAVGVKAINGTALPDHRSQDGSIDEDRLLQKTQALLRLPTHLILDMIINQMWFDIRVRSISLFEELKNG